MPTIQSTLSLASRALMAQQNAISVASNNVANVNTPGYARRRAEMRSLEGGLTLNGTYGNGVDVVSIQSLRDPYIEQQVRRGLGESGYYETEYQQLALIESMIGGMEDSGLSSALDRFWNSWHDLANDPSSLANRNIVRESANNLIKKMNDINGRLAEQQEMMVFDFNVKLDRINVITTEIARLNSQMSRGGGQDVELGDRRAALMDELSSLAGAEFRIEDDNTVSVFIGGANVVDKVVAQPLALRHNQDGNYELFIASRSNNPLEGSNGEIGALMDVLNNEMEELQEYLDEFAVTLVSHVNKVHQKGYGLDGLGKRNFFDTNTSGMGDIALDDEILRDINAIAASSDGQSADNRTALEIAELQTSTSIYVGGSKIGDALASMDAWLGYRVSEARDLSDGSTLTLQQLESWRDSASGVSLDEEMANMVKYQQAFNAAAKVVAAVDSMLQSLIGMV